MFAGERSFAWAHAQGGQGRAVGGRGNSFEDIGQVFVRVDLQGLAHSDEGERSAATRAPRGEPATRQLFRPMATLRIARSLALVSS